MGGGGYDGEEVEEGEEEEFHCFVLLWCVGRLPKGGEWIGGLRGEEGWVRERGRGKKEKGGGYGLNWVRWYLKFEIWDGLFRDCLCFLLE